MYYFLLFVHLSFHTGWPLAVIVPEAVSLFWLAYLHSGSRLTC